MANLVLDTNSLIQCVSRRSAYHGLWLSLLDGRNRLCVTTEILDEYVEIMEQKAGAKYASLVLEIITSSPYTLFVTPYYHFNLIVADPDDNKFVDCAITAGATFIVSNDRHFNELQQYDFPKVAVRTLPEFLEIVRKL